MDVTALILCAGSSERWRNYQGVPKQLLEFNGETLLERTTRLLQSQYVANPIIVTLSPSLKIPNVQSFAPNKTTYIVDTVASTTTLWSSRTIVLLGDVFYTKWAIKRIVGSTEPFKIFGRPWPSIYSGCAHGELFALSFTPEVHAFLLIHLARVSDHGSQGGRGNLWNLYQSMMQFPYDSKLYDRDILGIIDDFTDDFDSPDEYDRAARCYKAYAAAGLGGQFAAVILRRILNPFPLVWLRRRKFMREPLPKRIEVPFSRSAYTDHDATRAETEKA